MLFVFTIILILLSAKIVVNDKKIIKKNVTNLLMIIPPY